MLAWRGGGVWTLCRMQWTCSCNSYAPILLLLLALLLLLNSNTVSAHPLRRRSSPSNNNNNWLPNPLSLGQDATAALTWLDHSANQLSNNVVHGPHTQPVPALLSTMKRCWLGMLSEGMNIYIDHDIAIFVGHAPCKNNFGRLSYCNFRRTCARREKFLPFSRDDKPGRGYERPQKIFCLTQLRRTLQYLEYLVARNWPHIMPSGCRC